MTNENKEETLQESSDSQLASQNDSQVVKEEPSLEEGTVVELTDNKEYPNQLEILRNISHLYQNLNPANKKIVRLTITRNS